MEGAKGSEREGLFMLSLSDGGGGLTYFIVTPSSVDISE